MKENDSQAPKKLIQGIIQVTRRPVGYVAWPSDLPGNAKGEDIEIDTEHLNGALNGDTVSVSLKGLFPRPKGAVVEILTRAKTDYVATLRKMDDKLVAVPDDQKFYRPIKIIKSIEGMIEGTKVLVHLLSNTATEATGDVVNIIGTAGEHRTEMNAIVLEHGFSTSFPEMVLREAAEIEKNHAKIIEEEAPKRADFRNVTTFTIDPADAKDFDDALSIQELPGGNYEIGIHIADATFFCRPGTAIDAEAVKRGTSVYLVDTTIPMLPNELSGNVCSLKEGEDRLAFSAVFTLNKKGDVLARRFEKSIIRSDKRFTYEEAQALLDEADEAEATEACTKLSASISLRSAPQPNFVSALQILRNIARELHKKRESEGAIDFGDNEVKFILDADGKPLGVVRKERIETNSLIEEFMLLANREVAQYVSKLAEKVPEAGYVFLYRIHDDPKEDRIDELSTFVHAIGYEFGGKKKKSARDIAQLLKDIEGKPEEHLIRTATLRTMAKAIYSTKNIGHFGLAFEYYTHFTSPIRRYPDMLVHRILASHLDGHPMTRREFGHLENMCLTASEQEAKAVSAERASIRYKQVEYMLGKIGQEFDAVISGVTDWGLYVEDAVSACEGLVRVRSLGDDFYNFNQKEYALVGQRTKRKYVLGDNVRVKLTAADLAARTLDFVLI